MEENYSEAAHRHRHDALKLASDGRFQNAGYLIGLAAECLVKRFLENDRVIIDKKSGFRCHFPNLGQKIMQHAAGRNMSKLRRAMNENFLLGWQIELRYEKSPSPEDAEARWNKWQTDVNGLFRAVGRI